MRDARGIEETGKSAAIARRRAGSLFVIAPSRCRAPEISRALFRYRALTII